jgi:hypothetical protein
MVEFSDQPKPCIWQQLACPPEDGIPKQWKVKREEGK